MYPRSDRVKCLVSSILSVDMCDMSLSLAIVSCIMVSFPLEIKFLSEVMESLDNCADGSGAAINIYN